MTTGQSNILWGWVQDMIVTGGGSVVTAFMATVDLQTKTIAFPGWPALTVALILGAIAATRRAQSKIESPVAQRAVRTPEELAAQAKAREDAITVVVERVLKARPPAVPPVAVTPQRVPEPPPVVAAAPVVPELTRVPRERDLPGGTP